MRAEHKRQMWIGVAAAALFFVGGVVLITLGIQSYRNSRAFVDAADSAPGRVTGIKRWKDPRAGTRKDLRCAVITYTLPGGKEVVFDGPTEDGLVRLRHGQEVCVLYNPQDPTDARVDCFMGLWFASTMFLGLGIGAVFIPLLTLWQGWRWIQRQEAGPGDTPF